MFDLDKIVSNISRFQKIELKKRLESYSNKKLVDMINYRYNNGLNDDDYIAELCRRRKASGEQIAKVNGEFFIMVSGSVEDFEEKEE